MIQPIAAEATVTPSTTVTQYINPATGYISTAIDVTTQILISGGGILKNLRVEGSSSPGSGKSRVFTVMKNGVDTALTCTIADLNSNATDIANNVSVVAGDVISIKSAPVNTPSGVDHRVSLQFESTNAKENMLFSGISTNSTATTYFQASGYNTITTNTIDDFAILVPHACTIKALQVLLGTQPGVGKSYTLTVMKNGAAETSSNVTISDTNTTGNVTGLNISLAQGDRIEIRSTSSGTPATGTINIGLLLESTTDGESIVGSNSSGSPSNSLTTYAAFGRRGDSGFNSSASAAGVRTIGGIVSFVIKNLHIRHKVAPGGATSYTYTVRKNNGDTTEIAAISGANTIANDTSNTVSIAQGNSFNLKIVPASTPTVPTRVSISATIYVAPSVINSGASFLLNFV